jgi:hypothetical protein
MEFGEKCISFILQYFILCVVRRDCMNFVSDVLVIRKVLSEQELEILRKECDAAYCTFTESQLADCSCALDLFEHSEISDKSLVRHVAKHYFDERWRNQCVLSTEEKTVMENIICRKLPSILQQLVFNTEKVFLFNEHYVVKPPSSDLTFRWHTDNEEQLQCLAEHNIVYYSMWCPLDDVCERNGTLVVPANCAITKASFTDNETQDPSHSLSFDKEKHGGTFDRRQGRAIVAPAGSVVIFPSDLMHCSGPNQTQTCRRVFYSQYSQSIISIDKGNLGGTTELPHPLCFAVECDFNAGLHSRMTEKSGTPLLLCASGPADSVVVSTANNFGLNVSYDDDSEDTRIEIEDRLDCSDRLVAAASNLMDSDGLAETAQSKKRCKQSAAAPSTPIHVKKARVAK